MHKRLIKEREFHNDRFAGEDLRRGYVKRFYSISPLQFTYYENLVNRYCKGGDLLEYGCGKGYESFFWAKKGFNVVGIDISGEAIKRAKKFARERKINANFYEMNAENLKFQNESFDVVFGLGILHHLDLNRACREIARVLRKDGHAVFIEPLGHNFFINLYRRLTPHMRTENEHPILMQDIKEMGKYFMTINSRYFHIFTLLAVPFRNLFFFQRLLKLLHKFDDSIMFFFPFLRRYAWMVVLELNHPI